MPICHDCQDELATSLWPVHRDEALMTGVLTINLCAECWCKRDDGEAVIVPERANWWGEDDDPRRI